jgi:hypothetical protein
MESLVVLLILAAGVAVVLMALVMVTRPPTGTAEADVAASPGEFLDIAAETFVADGWDVGYRGGDSLVLRREFGPDPVLGCILTAFVLPIGVAYLLATKNRATVVFQVKRAATGRSRVAALWAGRALKRPVSAFLTSLG